MGDKFTNTGYIKVTDMTGPQKSADVGYHTVPQTVVLSGVDVPWTMPQMNGDGQDWEFVDIAEVRANAPQVLAYNPDELPEADRPAAAVKSKASE